MPEDQIKLDAGAVLPENLVITDEFKKLNNLIENSSSKRNPKATQKMTSF